MACCSCKFNCSKGRLNQISYIKDMACYACSSWMFKCSINLILGVQSLKIMLRRMEWNKMK